MPKTTVGDVTETVGAWVRDTAQTVAEAASDVASSIDVDDVKDTASEFVDTAQDRATGVLQAVATAAPVALTSRRRGRTMLGLASTAAAAYYLDPRNGAERRARTAAKLKSWYESVKERFQSDEPETGQPQAA